MSIGGIVLEWVIAVVAVIAPSPILLGWGLRAAIYQISPLDPVTLGAATGILGIASLAASIIPARRAAHVLPVRALRHDQDSLQ
jgi:ABC-type lipoprotein release transport system permease subunit